MSSNDNGSQQWNGVDVSAHRWDPAEMSNPPASLEGIRKDDGWKRPLSVFANSTYQPQQMLFDGGKAHESSTAGALPSAYQSLPSDTSSQIVFPQGSLPLLQPGLQGSGPNLYPSIDHTESISHPFSFLERNGGAHGFAQAPNGGFTIQCGRFNAPIQREGLDAPGASFPLLSGRTPVAQPEKMRKLDRQASFANPLQLQEYYTAQSDILEELMRNNRAMQQHIHNTNNLVTQAGGDLDSEFMDILSHMSQQQAAPMHRANSALEVPLPQHPGGYPSLEPYMPQWSSESVPAELPNHVVNRLLMRQPLPGDRFSVGGPLSGMKRPKGALDSLPPVSNLLYNPAMSLSDNSKKPSSTPESPDVKELEELARTADAEVAHRAFLVPAHKKRGKGGRQPAQDPRLDPNIDERKAKRILANRLSAARSKMKQKNQMEGMSKMVEELERHQKALQDDAADLMELCEKMERQNRKLARDEKILEEYLARNDRANPLLAQTLAHRHLPPDLIHPY